MTCKNTYIAYNKDDIYELPLFVGNTNQIAQYIGCSPKTIRQANYRDSVIQKKYKVEVVAV